MTLDDLQRIYHAAWRDHEGSNPQRAGIIAVVTALREVICDNVYMTQECCGHGVPSRDGRHEECCYNPVHSITRDNLIMSFSEILAPREGGSREAGGPRPEAVGSTPPAAPAPVCEWVPDVQFRNAFSTGCGYVARKRPAGSPCICAKPISFKTEAQR